MTPDNPFDSGRPRPIATVLDALRARLHDLGSVVVAFSGGADSAFLAWVANDTLGAGAVRCLTALSPSFPALAAQSIAQSTPRPPVSDCTWRTASMADGSRRRL